MLHKITIENFRSIADQQELTFAVPGNAPDLPCFRTSRINKEIRLPTVLGFFGANASGKSTLLHAIVSTLVFACTSFDRENAGILFQPHRQKDWLNKPTKISIDFDSQLKKDNQNALFRYELHITHTNNPSDKKVSYEALSYAPQGKFRRLFERIEQKFHFGNDFNMSNDFNDPRVASIRPNASVISTLAKFNHSSSIDIIQHMHAVLISGLIEQSINYNQLWVMYDRDKNLLNHLNKTLKRLDIGLESMQLELGPQGLFAKLKHTGLDDFIFFPEESTGTRRFIEVFPRLHYALEIGGIAIVDELDIAIHPLLLPELFRWFNNQERNPHGAQLLFSAQNPAALDELEKEQVFFTEKAWGQSKTQIYGARDIKGLRREPSLMKKYLSGELGAIPHIG